MKKSSIWYYVGGIISAIGVGVGGFVMYNAGRFEVKEENHEHDEETTERLESGDPVYFRGTNGKAYKLDNDPIEENEE